VQSAGEGMRSAKPACTLRFSFSAASGPARKKSSPTNLTAAIHRCEQLLAFEAPRKTRRKNVSVQLKIDSGMNRLGIMPKDADCFARQLAKCKHLNLVGTFTHLASSEV